MQYVSIILPLGFIGGMSRCILPEIGIEVDGIAPTGGFPLL